MNKTGINWCDYTINFVTGCTKMAQGCKFCYAEGIAKRFWGNRKFSDIQFHEERLNDPKLRSKKPLRIFVNSMSDLFHEELSFEQIEKVINVIATHPQHTYLVLTKRFKRSIEFFDWWDNKLKDYGGYELPNWIQIGYSASTQIDLDSAMEYLHRIKGSTKWLSIEPMLQSIDISRYDYAPDWIVVGSESGYKRRVCYKEWIYDLVAQCKFYKIPVWVKQMQISLKRDVVDDIKSFPKELQIRELPK